MNATTIFTGIFSCLLLMLTLTHSYALSGKLIDDEQHHLLIERPSIVSPNQFASIYHDEAAINEDHDDHQFEKRRFNAWAGKRNTMAKRRFNAWAGRR